VKHRVGATGNFVASKVGAQLPAGSRVQTGARSKCALKFPNGGVIRMGERSDLVIQSPTDTSVKLSGGQLWAKVIAGTTARVEGSYGVAVVKGTEWTFDGVAITCFDGIVSYETAAGATDVPMGYEGRANADGTVARSPAPGREYPGGDLIQWFGGMVEGVSVAATPGASPGGTRKEQNISVDRAIAEAVTPEAGNLHVIVESLQTTTAAARARASVAADPARADAPWGFFPGVDPNTLAPLSLSHPIGAGGALASSRLGQAPELPDRQYFFGPYTAADAFGYVTDGGGTLGLRVRPHAVWGPVYLEVGATTRISKWYGDGTDITEAFATYRDEWGEATVGRQRFLEGPVNNSRLGSLLTFDTGDAVRAQAAFGKLSVDAAYVRTMAPIIGPKARGWYGRLEYPVLDGSAGLNIVTNQAAGGDAGFSVDLAAPVIRGQLDLYGEYGVDPFDRELYTIGAYFPGLYQSEDVDLFVEYAAREELPSLATLRLYKHFSEELTGVFSLDKASGDSLHVGAGAIWRFGD
ncbi:MAG: FecR domain-containing protein, partial [Armatimonadetes bacterium]|nr:FecR domain-containing protein [Armatimonadota bacterium]